MLQNVEVDINKAAHIKPAIQQMIRHKCQAMVVSPDLVTSATIDRGISRCNFKIITTIDWPKGTQGLSDKFRGLPTEALNADGFEILLPPNKKVGILKEVKFLSEFFRNHFPQTTEFRFVLGWYAIGRDPEMLMEMCEACKTIPTPSLIRTTHLTKIPAAESTVESHQKMVEAIKSVKRMPVKISGNVNHAAYRSCKADKFACSYEQFIQLCHDEQDVGMKKLNKVISKAETPKIETIEAKAKVEAKVDV